MKNTIKHFWIVTLVAVIVVCFVSCDLTREDDGSGNATITISGIPKVGETVTITLTGNNDYWIGSLFHGYADTSNASQWAEVYDGQTGLTFTISKS